MNLLDRALTSEEIRRFQDKPYDFCHLCKKLSITCEGPNLLAMDGDRLTEWLNHRADALRLTQQDIAEQAEVAVGTVNNVFAGRSKDMRVGTLRAIVRVLIGGCWGHPCHHAQMFLSGLDTDEDKVILLERQIEETKRELADRTEELERARKVIEELHNSYNHEIEAVRQSFTRELDRVRESYQKEWDKDRETWRWEFEKIREDAQAKIDYLKLENERKDKVIDKLLSK